jgi:cytochrome P450
MPAVAAPPPVSSNPLRRMAEDVRRERAATVPFPPGETRYSMVRTMRFARDPLPMLLELYERHGPVFTQRVFHHNVVFMLGPAANHYMTVSHASNFSWREGHLGDLMPLLGDGLLTIDGEFHRRSRLAMVPMFHKERIAAARRTMEEEVDAALAAWHDGMQLDLYRWTRELALRIAMRALFGLDPDRAAHRVDAATEFERALGFWSKDYILQVLRGPGTPWNRMVKARRRLDSIVYSEIERRRATGERGDDLLSMLLDAHDEDGLTLSREHIRDEVMTLLFAGHDTTTSTVTFLFYELSHNAALVDDPGFDLGLAVDETLRMYPPAWIGPRRSIEPFEFEGVPVPGRVPVEYCSWASHRLPDVWGDPDVFRPERFAPGNREQIPKGAYVPFGGGSRTCIGMRFGQAEIGVIASRILERFRLDVDPGYRLRIRQMPTIGPRDGLPVTVRAARPAATTERPPHGAAAVVSG